MIPLGPFDLIKPIGRGGSCEVWRGVHREQDLPVAVKVVFGRKARTPRFISAFREEVRAVAGLEHPSIVMVFDYGLIPQDTAAQSGGRLIPGSPFLVMELGEETLHSFCDRLSWPRLYNILLSLLDGLAHAHARGVIHRDIKPANILVCDNNRQVKLSDFGLAHAFEGNEAPRHAREIVGTPSYMAPEQFELRWRDYGPWTDLYAFGCMTYTLLCGFPPFGRTEQLEDMMAAHLYQPVPPLPPRLPVPAGFEGWLHRLLQKNPADRFQRAADAAWALLQLGQASPFAMRLQELEERSSPFAPGGSEEGQLLGEGESPTLHTLHSLMGTPTPSALPAVPENYPHALHPESAQFIDEVYSAGALHDEKGAGLHDIGEVEETYNHPPELSLHFPMPEATQEEQPKKPLPVEQTRDLRGDATPTPVPGAPIEQDLRGEVPVVLADLGEAMPPFPETWRRDELRERSRLLNDVGLGLYGLRSVPLVGREQERDRLWSSLKRVVMEQEGRCVILHGPAGCGKSRLANWLTERSHEVGAVTVLKANHSPIPGPADGFGAMLSRHLRCSGLGRAEIFSRVETRMAATTHTAREQVQAVTELISPMGRTHDDKLPSIRFGNPSERYEAIRQYLAFLCGGRSVVLWLDDIHWSFDALSFVHYVMEDQSQRPLPLLMLLTVREETIAERTGEAALLDDIRQHEHTEQIEIGPLSQQENTALVQELLGLRGDLALQVEQRTAGNPLFAVQLVGDWVQRGLLRRSVRGFQLKEGVKIEIPDSLHQVWTDRVDRLLETRTLDEAIALELAATLGIEVDRDEWLVVCELAQVPVPDALLDHLFGLRLAYRIEGSSRGSWAFVHSMLRECLERLARESGRWEEHQRHCAQMLRQKEGPGMAERLGKHLLHAGDLRGAVKPLLKGIWEYIDAGDFRLGELIFADWRSLLKRLALPPDEIFWGEAWLLRARLARGTGSYEQAGRLATILVKDARKYGWSQILIYALLEQANCGWRLGADDDEVWLLLEEALTRASTLGKPELEAECRRYMGNFLCHRGKLNEALELLNSSYQAFVDIGDEPGMARCCFGMSNVERQAGHFDRAREHVKRAQERYEACGIRRGVVDCLNSLGDLARFEGDLEQSEAYYRESLSRYEILGAGGTSICKLNITLVLIGRELFAESQELLGPLIVHLRKKGQRDLEGIAHLCLLPSLVVSESWAEWDLHREQAQKLLDETGLCDVDTARIANLSGDMARNAGQHERAKAAYQLCASQWRLLGREDEIEAIQSYL